MSIHTTLQNLTIDEECLGLIYVLDTLLDFAHDAEEQNISISTVDAVKIIKKLKQVPAQGKTYANF